MPCMTSQTSLSVSGTVTSAPVAVLPNVSLTLREEHEEGLGSLFWSEPLGRNLGRKTRR